MTKFSDMVLDDEWLAEGCARTAPIRLGREDGIVSQDPLTRVLESSLADSVSRALCARNDLMALGRTADKLTVQYESAIAEIKAILTTHPTVGLERTEQTEAAA